MLLGVEWTAAAVTSTIQSASSAPTTVAHDLEPPSPPTGIARGQNRIVSLTLNSLTSQCCSFQLGAYKQM